MLFLTQFSFSQDLHVGFMSNRHLYSQQNPKSSVFSNNSSFSSFGFFIGYVHKTRKERSYFYSVDLASFSYGFDYKTKPDEVIFTKLTNYAEIEIQMNALRLFPISLSNRMELQLGIGPSLRFSPIGYGNSKSDEYYMINSDKYLYELSYQNKIPLTLSLNFLAQTDFKVNDALKIVLGAQFQQGVWKAHRLNVSYSQFTNNQLVNFAEGTFWGRGSRWGIQLGLKYTLNFS